MAEFLRDPICNGIAVIIAFISLILGIISLILDLYRDREKFFPSGFKGCSRLREICNSFKKRELSKCTYIFFGIFFIGLLLACIGKHYIDQINNLPSSPTPSSTSTPTSTPTPKSTSTPTPPPPPQSLRITVEYEESKDNVITTYLNADEVYSLLETISVKGNAWVTVTVQTIDAYGIEISPDTLNYDWNLCCMLNDKKITSTEKRTWQFQLAPAKKSGKLTIKVTDNMDRSIMADIPIIITER